jgi:dolichol-phosphate mannosyltransferase
MIVTDQERVAKLDRILVFMASYNEADNIPTLLNKIWSHTPQVDILAVDDHSPDGTGILLDEIAKTTTQLKVIHRPRKLGLGTAHHLAMIFAIKHSYDVLITMDADHSHNPEDIPRLLEKLNAADFVIGSRYARGGSCDYGGYRKFLSISANVAARCLLGISLHEFTTSYRAFRVSALAKVNFVKMHNQGYSFFMESVYRFNQAGLRLAEIPIYFGSRNAGVSKIPRLEIVRGMLKLVHLVGSRVLRRKMPVVPPLINDHCAHCDASFLSEYYPRQLNTPSEADQSNAFRCSSMVHANKPCLAKCLQCGLIQVPQAEHPQDLEHLYADVVDHQYLNNLPAKRKTFSRAYQSIKPFLPEQQGRLLEVGSYCGLFLSEAKKYGWEVSGIEPSRWAASHAQLTYGQEVVTGNLETVAPSLKKEFDAVVTWDVLEHVRNPTEYLKVINGLLKNGGTVALSTLDISSWFPRLVGHYWPWIMEMHLFYFDSQVLKHIFNEAGFEMLCTESYCHYASLRYIYQKFCAVFPSGISRFLLMGSRLVPTWVVPVTLGDIKLYVGKKKCVPQA